MGPVFADTFYWVALTNVKDAAHEQAKTFSRSSSLSSIVTTELVLIEYLNYFAAWGSEFRLMALANTRGLRSSSTARVVPCTAEAFQDGLALPRQGLQPHRLHLHADDETGRAHRGLDQ